MDPLECARAIAAAVKTAGGRALVVGGWVRDRLMGRDTKDIDIEVYGVASDRLRALRAVQCAARLDFTVDEPTRAMCRTIALDDLPAERVWGEIEKLLLARCPSIGFALALDLGVVSKLFPELDALVDCQQEPE